ncbi:hypothetical protein V8D89_009433 [Ganoderma adspersum]
MVQEMDVETSPIPMPPFHGPRRDTPYGWITDIPANVVIHKERAIKMYLLNSRDLDDVPFNDRLIKQPNRSYYCNEYKERDVEWKAWQIHGGPIRYREFLKQRLWAGRRFLCTLFPYSYCYHYMCDSIVLRDAKHTLLKWIWNACNTLLDRAFLGGHFSRSVKDLTSDHEDTMKLAITFFSWGMTVQGLDFVHTGTCKYYDWNTEYLKHVFTAACGVIAELGPGDQRWTTAHWEVYTKYCQLPHVGLSYDRAAKVWFHDTTAWMDSKLSDEELQGHVRSKCAARLTFNELLPLPEAPSSPPTQPSTQAQAGPSTILPARLSSSTRILPSRSPLAARSSA